MTSSTITAADRVFLAAANTSGRRSALFIHGLWLHGTSWTRWLDLFESYGFGAYAPSWPGDGMTALETRNHPARVAEQNVDDVIDRHRELIAMLRTPPIVVGHCFGGLIAQKILGDGLAEAAIAVDPTPIPGLPHAAAMPGWRARLKSTLTPQRGVTSLTQESFASGLGNKLSREESDRIYEKYAIPAPRRLLAQTGIASFPFDTPAAAFTPTTVLPPTTAQTHAHRGPLLIIGGSENQLVPHPTTRRVFQQYDDAPGITEFREFSDRGHTLVVDNGWSEVADYALGWLGFVGIAP